MLIEFSIFLKTFSALEFPLTATEYYAVSTSSALSVESIKLMTSIGAKM